MPEHVRWKGIDDPVSPGPTGRIYFTRPRLLLVGVDDDRLAERTRSLLTHNTRSGVRGTRADKDNGFSRPLLRVSRWRRRTSRVKAAKLCRW